jgi:hypothetical protein
VSLIELHFEDLSYSPLTCTSVVSMQKLQSPVGYIYCGDLELKGATSLSRI